MTGITEGSGRGRAALEEVLQRAGLEVVGEWRTENVVPPWVAWRPMAAASTEPTVAVPESRPDQVEELNAQWYRLAVEHGILGEGGAGVFLINVPGSWNGPGAGEWTRVRLASAGWDLAGVLGERAGRPEFVTLSLDGEVLLGATAEEYETWLVLVDGIPARQEAAAVAAAKESPEEQEAAWEALFRGPKPIQRLRDAWARGLAFNSAVPVHVLTELTGLTTHHFWRPLPAPVVDAMLAHPDRKVRYAFAEVQPNITAEHWERLILGEGVTAQERWISTFIAADRGMALTEAAYESLCADPDDKVRAEAVRLRGLPGSLLAVLCGDPVPGVRAQACRRAWSDLTEPERRKLLADAAAEPRRQALLMHHREHPLSRVVFDAQDLGVTAVETCRLEGDFAAQLATHQDPELRRALARNPYLSADLVGLLAVDADAEVRGEVAVRPGLTEEQRAAVRIEFDPGIQRHALEWVTALHDDVDAMRRLAGSSHPLIRRSVARARHLPPDVVSLLARDEDRVVQLFLAESCEDAPADMLLSVWQWWTGSLSFPDRPRAHPKFPRHRLLRYADDPNPRMRQLALDDPKSTPELVDRFSRDPDREVRCRAASDPRLTVVAAVRLLEDPEESVRFAAVGHPRLPARVLVRLLRDAAHAQRAARNPGLPVEVMRRMVRRMVER
ncbi:HEAT repeat domain-containing protein [Streptomyces sp. NPDC004111]|uniref:HEAT repeat domain-containing protein n=1 Tax=Streptomyces sp. NPDC004111 TaxID=3364690 RepID=UPI0036C63227